MEYALEIVLLLVVVMIIYLIMIKREHFSNKKCVKNPYIIPASYNLTNMEQDRYNTGLMYDNDSSSLWDVNKRIENGNVENKRIKNLIYQSKFHDLLHNIIIIYQDHRTHILEN